MAPQVLHPPAADAPGVRGDHGRPALKEMVPRLKTGARREPVHRSTSKARPPVTDAPGICDLTMAHCHQRPRCPLASVRPAVAAGGSLLDQREVPPAGDLAGVCGIARANCPRNPRHPTASVRPAVAAEGRLLGSREVPPASDWAGVYGIAKAHWPRTPRCPPASTRASVAAGVGLLGRREVAPDRR